MEFKCVKKEHRLYFTVDGIDYLGKTKLRFVVKLSNAKVHLPIIDCGSALECPNRSKCAFSEENRKRTGYPLCYAQATEKRWKTVKRSRDLNQSFILYLSALDSRNHGNDATERFTKFMSAKIAMYAPFTPYVRINEAHDISPENINFLHKTQLWFNALDTGISMYGYTKTT